MSVAAGSVTIDPITGDATGSDAALAIYNGLLATYSPQFPDMNTPPAEWTQTTQSPDTYRTAKGFNCPAVAGYPAGLSGPCPAADAAWSLLSALQQWQFTALQIIINQKMDLARQANGHAQLVPYMTANAVCSVVVHATSGTPPAGGDGLQTVSSIPTTAPLADKTLEGTLS